MTEAVKQRLQQELDELDQELRVELPKQIKTAKEWGDLRENAEYHAALARQQLVQARIQQLRQRLSEVSSIDLSKVPHGKAAYGSTLVLYDAEEEQTRFLHASSRMPATLNPEVFRPPTPNYTENRRGAKAISTPGNANAWEAL